MTEQFTLISEQFYAIQLRHGGLAIGGFGAPQALFRRADDADRFNRELKANKIKGGRRIRVVMTIKLDKGHHT